MKRHTFDREISAARRHLEALRREPGARRTLLKEALSNLSNALEEIQAAAVQLLKHGDELAVAGARARAILDAVVDGIITIDAQGTIESFNPAAQWMFGYVASAC
jgi:PAS domain-containing protein